MAACTGAGMSVRVWRCKEGEEERILPILELPPAQRESSPTSCVNAPLLSFLCMDGLLRE